MILGGLLFVGLYFLFKGDGANDDRRGRRP
jgi:hypothetical protein